MATNKNTATKAAAKKADAAPKYAKPYMERKKELQDECAKTFGSLMGHFATVEGGRKIDHGTVVEVKWVGVTRRLAMASIVIHKGEETWVDPRHLKKGKPLPKEKVALFEAEREEKASETVRVAGRVVNESESGKSICLDYSGWGYGRWIAKTLAERVGTMPDGRFVFDVAAFRVRQIGGQDSVDALNAKREAIDAEMIEYDGTEPDLSQAA